VTAEDAQTGDESCRTWNSLVFGRERASCQIPPARGDSPLVSEITDSLGQALDRIDEFRSIHESRAGGVTIEAVRCLQEAVDIADPTRELIRERLYETEGPPSEPSQMFLGLIVGLLTAQFAAVGSGVEGP
jgi:hypothetical protein